MEAVFGKSTCINSWMQLVRKVSSNFPGLETEECIEEHEQTVLKFMNKKTGIMRQKPGNNHWCSSFFAQQEHDLLFGCGS